MSLRYPYPRSIDGLSKIVILPLLREAVGRSVFLSITSNKAFGASIAAFWTA